MKRLFSSLIVLCSLLSVAVSQKIPLTEGTRYMVAFPQVWASASEEPLPQPILLFISSKFKTTVRVQTPAVNNSNPRIDRTFTINPNSTLRVPIPISYMNSQSETKVGSGIFVTSPKPISVSTYEAWTGNGELARHLPIEAWGKLYSTMNFFQDRFGKSTLEWRPSQILIIAAKDNTIVSYTPTWDTEGGTDMLATPAGKTSTVELMAGEVYLIRGKIDDAYTREFTSDLSGTIIKSSKPIGVISGHTKVAIMRYPDVLPPTGATADAHFVRNNVHDAMLPVELGGTEFVVVPTMYSPRRTVGNLNGQGSAIGIDDDKGDVVRFNSLEDGTVVSEVRPNGSLKNLRTLRKNETFIIPSQEYAAVFRSSRPILCGQYGKSWANVTPPVAIGRDVTGKTNELPQGHPTVEAGMPMLEYVPSTDRWVNYGVFYAPEGMDNFFNIAFKFADIGSIKFDGRSLTSIAGGSLRQITGTPYAHVRFTITNGDHVVESTTPSVKWMGWNYGSLDGMQMGRAYGTPVGIDLAIPCDDSLNVVEQIICGNVTGKFTVSPSTSCGAVYTIYYDSLNNYTYVTDLDPSPLVIEFGLVVSDKTQDASGELVFISRSGNVIIRKYQYGAPHLSVSPTWIDFGVKALGSKVCSTAVLKNNGKQSITVLSIRTTQPEFSVSPSSVTIAAGDSVVLNICGEARSTIAVIDTIIASTECLDIKLVGLQIRGDEPTFFASDRNWGIIPYNDKQTKKVTLQNIGRSSVTVTDYQPRGNAYFTNATLISSLPLVLKAGEIFQYNVDYSPNGEVGVAHTLRINYVVNATKQKLYSDLNGLGSNSSISISSFSWKERVVDGYQLLNGVTTYTGSISIENVGNAPALVSTIDITGADASVFKFGNVFDDAGGSVPRQIMPGKSYTIPVFFTPSEQPSRAAERVYASTITAKYTVAGENREIMSSLEGTALQPQISLTDQSWQTRAVSSVTTLSVRITNDNKSNIVAPLNSSSTGTMDLIIDSVAIQNGSPFVWTINGSKQLKFTPALVISPGAYHDIPVDYSPLTSGTFVANWYAYGNVLDTNFAKLSGDAPQSNEIQPLYLLSWIGIPINGLVTGTCSYTTTLRFKEFRGADYVQFNIAQSQLSTDISVVAGSPFTFGVEFKPNFVTLAGIKVGQDLRGRLPYRDNKFTTQIVFEDLITGQELIGDISGDGKYLETTLKISAPKDIPIGSNAPVTLTLIPAPEAIDSGNVESTRLRLMYDGSVLWPVQLTSTSFPTALLVEESASQNMVEIDLVTPIQVNGLLGNKVFSTTLNVIRDVPITGEYYMINKGGKTASPYVVVNVIPDNLTITQVCSKLLRLVSVGTRYNMVMRGNVLEVTVGYTGSLSIVMSDELGRQLSVFSGQVQAGTYEFDVSGGTGLHWVVASHGDWTQSVGIFIHP